MLGVKRGSEEFCETWPWIVVVMCGRKVWSWGVDNFGRVKAKVCQ